MSRDKLPNQRVKIMEGEVELCESVLDFIEGVIEVIVGEFCCCSDQRKEEILDIGELALHYAVLIENLFPGAEDFVSLFRELLRELWSEVTLTFPRRQRGHPEVAITEEQLRFLVENEFKTKHIAELFGCSRRTIEC